MENLPPPDLLRTKYLSNHNTRGEYRVVTKFDYSRHFPLPIEDLLKYYCSNDDAVYRSDFLDRLLEDKPFQRKIADISSSLPTEKPFYINDEEHYHSRNYEGDYDAYVASHIALINRHLNTPNILEAILELPNFPGAVEDMRVFASRALPQFNPLRSILSSIDNKQFTKDDGYDVELANKCVLKLYRFNFQSVYALYNQLRYYLRIRQFYEQKCQGITIPSCKPEFLDSDLRKGKILQAHYFPSFQYATVESGKPDRRGRKNKKTIISQLTIPNDICWEDDARATFITGPNSMGKSFYLKMVAMNINLAMVGLRPLAESCQMSFPGKIYSCLDLGDSIGHGHFMTGINQVNYMLDNVTINDLVFMDEVGGGTEPEAERVISKGISDALIKTGITFWDVTHDRGAWNNYSHVPRIAFLKAADLSDSEHKYQILPGIATGGYAMELAKQKCVDPDSVLARLKQRISIIHQKNPKTI